EVQYHDYCDIAIAVGTPKGLVVPVLRNAESLSYAGVESGILELAKKARDGKLTLEEMQGGTFTITNGGIYGSMMSTPILNAPQSGILGMHNIVKRPVENPDKPGEIALRPMMYIALSYDHRIVDGEGAVTFLKHVKDCIEDPERMLLEV
ncbi:MAG: 2-oxo acid dehydrogenase subunit E2, partial [bacterium]|nr:2-oxo acid dehydrogenase subunit E2 [bacterium]